METTSRKRYHDVTDGAICNKQAATMTHVLEKLTEPNFEQLARIFPAFGVAWRHVEANRKAAHSKLSSQITQEFSINLTKALLHVYFSVSLCQVPSHHLCPPIPNRFFYVRWILEDLMPLQREPNYFDPRPTTSIQQFTNITGLDIGTGAVCIYPLLCCASCETIKMYACDIDPEAIAMAQANVDSNQQLRNRIHVYTVPESDQQLNQKNNTILLDHTSIHPNGIFPVGPLRRSLEHLPPSTELQLTFCMTNPPFYDVSDSTVNPRVGDGRARTAMTSSEGLYPGGEIGFCIDMIVDSLYLHIQSQSPSGRQATIQECLPFWTSTMCGKKTSWVLLKHLVTQLLGPAHICDTEFGPGQMTRWFLAWSFCRPCVTSPLARLPIWNFTVDLTSSVPIDKVQCACAEIVNRIQAFCSEFTEPSLMVKEFSFDTQRLTQKLMICELLITTPPWKGDEALPGPIQNALRSMNSSLRMEFLPKEGHFLLDVAVSGSVHQPSLATIQIDAFQHSTYGKKAIEKIKCHLEGEVGRTNRRWRRKLHREECNVESCRAMDES